MMRTLKLTFLSLPSIILVLVYFVFSNRALKSPLMMTKALYKLMIVVFLAVAEVFSPALQHIQLCCTVTLFFTDCCIADD